MRPLGVPATALGDAHLVYVVLGPSRKRTATSTHVVSQSSRSFYGSS